MMSRVHPNRSAVSECKGLGVRLIMLNNKAYQVVAITQCMCIHNRKPYCHSDKKTISVMSMLI